MSLTVSFRVSPRVRRFVFSKLLKMRNLQAIPLVLIPEDGQSNETIIYLNKSYHTLSFLKKLHCSAYCRPD